MPIFRAELEHIFASSLFRNEETKQFLNENGFTEQMVGNRIGLFSEADTVTALQNASPELQNFLIEAGFGLTRHDSNDIAAGGFQLGKNNFLSMQIIRIMNNDIASPEAKRFAVLGTRLYGSVANSSISHESITSAIS